MDRYQKVKKQKPATPINENEIRITAQGLVRNYISYATAHLQEKQGREIVLQGMGQAIHKAVVVAEILKRNIPLLHQENGISSVSITDVWEPLEEGLCCVEQTRNVSMIAITLSTKELNKNSAGYQAPSKLEQARPQYNNQRRPRQALQPYNVNYEDSYGRGGGRDRGQGLRRDGHQNYQENAGYSNRGRGGGARGSGRGYNGNGNGRGRGYGGSRGKTGSRPPRAAGNQSVM